MYVAIWLNFQSLKVTLAISKYLATYAIKVTGYPLIKFVGAKFSV